jgi:DNA invertase Pin-like site-specific DNA recombinase
VLHRHAPTPERRKTCKFREKYKTAQNQPNLPRESISQKQIELLYILQRIWYPSMKIGYARVSTEDQKLTIQLEVLKKAGCTRIFREKVSGAYRDRPELNRMLDQLRQGDVVTVWKLDRLARSTRNLLEIVETIGSSGARFQSISEPWADTTTHAGKMIMTIFAGIAEFERDLIRERTGVGRAEAQKRGVRFGRPKKMNEEQRNLANRLIKEGKSVSEVARTFSVHPATLYRILAPAP